MNVRCIYLFAFIVLSAEHVTSASSSYKSSGKLWGECVKNNITNFETCKGPMSKNLVDMDVKLVYDKRGKGKLVGSYKLLEDASSMITIVRTYMLENDQFKKIWNTQENNVCKPSHAFISDVMKLAEVDKKTCTALKTDHQVVDLSLYDILFKINQGKSLYGLYKIEMVTYSPTGNLFCISFQSLCDRG